MHLRHAPAPCAYTGVDENGGFRRRQLHKRSIEFVAFLDEYIRKATVDLQSRVLEIPTLLSLVGSREGRKVMPTPSVVSRAFERKDAFAGNVLLECESVCMACEDGRRSDALREGFE
jgi:hypothetical protein